MFPCCVRGPALSWAPTAWKPQGPLLIVHSWPCKPSGYTLPTFTNVSNKCPLKYICKRRDFYLLKVDHVGLKEDMSGQLRYGIPTQVQTLNGFRMAEARQGIKARILEIFLLLHYNYSEAHCLLFSPTWVRARDNWCKVVRCFVQVRCRVGEAEGNLLYAYACKNIYFLNTRIFFKILHLALGSPPPPCPGAAAVARTAGPVWVRLGRYRQIMAIVLTIHNQSYKLTSYHPYMSLVNVGEQHRSQNCGYCHHVHILQRSYHCHHSNF